MDFQQVCHRFWLCACCQPAFSLIQLLTTATAIFTHSQNICQEPTACPAWLQIQEKLQKEKRCLSLGVYQCVKDNNNKESQHTDSDSGRTDRIMVTVTLIPAQQVLTISKRIQKTNQFMQKEYYYSGLKESCSLFRCESRRPEWEEWNEPLANKGDGVCAEADLPEGLGLGVGDTGTQTQGFKNNSIWFRQVW